MAKDGLTLDEKEFIDSTVYGPSSPAKKVSYTEAPASVTFTIRTKNGFNALFSLREESGQVLIEKMRAVEQVFAQEGITPQPVKTFGSPKEVKYVQGAVCPLDGGKLVEKVSSTGKRYHACENGKYDFNTKQTVGCQYVNFNPS